MEPAVLLGEWTCAYYTQHLKEIDLNFPNICKILEIVTNLPFNMWLNNIFMNKASNALDYFTEAHRIALN